MQAPQYYSDSKFKENIKDINNGLDKILRLRSVQYNLKPEAFGINRTNRKEELKKKQQFGLIAQEVLKVIPEIVEEDSLGYSVSYESLIPFLICAVQEQNAMIEDLKKKYSSKEINEASTSSDYFKSSEIGIGTKENISDAKLGENRPNPFSSSTEIDLYIPINVEDAKIFVYNLQGKQLKSWIINDREETSLQIQGYELEAGIYYYSLIIDNQVVDTKQMYLTD